MFPSAESEKIGCDKWTDRYKSDPIVVPLTPIEVRAPKDENSIKNMREVVSKRPLQTKTLQ